ncbi:MAG: virulence RhuM family protein [Bacteroidales bacterium]|nr:virulence RhuM family protein [Bacteroidales bacterium]
MATEMKLYESNDALIQLDVLVENETVWLTQAQMTTLFQRDVSVVSRHIHNIFKEGELSMDSNLHFLQIANSDRPVAFYSLDVIISVGYRVKSRRGTEFRIWATNVLKEYIYRGYAISQRIDKVENQVASLSVQMQSLVQTALPPKQGVFYNGQIFDAYRFVSDLIRSAKTSILLIDNYVDDSVLTQLTKRTNGVTATIVVNQLTDSLHLDLERHNRQYPTINVRIIPAIHDRFLFIDDSRLYTFGASFKDLGRKLFCFTLMESPAVVAAVRQLME